MTDPPSTEIPLVPVRMVNEWVYCPRLAYLEWVDGEWADTGDTEDGRRTHARVDVASGRLPPPGEDQAEDTRPFQTRSVTMSSERLGIIAKMDVIEGQGLHVVPVDFKRGKRPHTEHGAYEPERVQVCAQALILEDAGYEVAEGALWFSGSRERVRVELDADLRARTLDAISGLRNAAQRRERPPPLEDSPKCPRCSLAGICLPDEVNFFKDEKPPRPLNPADGRSPAAARSDAGRAGAQEGRPAPRHGWGRGELGPPRRHIRGQSLRPGIHHDPNHRRASPAGNAGVVALDGWMVPRSGAESWTAGAGHPTGAVPPRR